MKNKFLYSFLIVSLLGTGVMTGCSNEKAESKATYRQMGIEYMEQGDYASAIESFEAALAQGIGTVGADELDITYYKAAAQYASGDAEAAMATYNAVLDYDDEASEAYYLRGCLYIKQGDIEAAKADFANAVKYNANDYELYINIYENLATADATEAGEAYLQQALLIKGSDVTSLEYRGQVHYLLGKYDDAVTELKAALEAGSTYANLYLAKAYEDMGDDAMAEEHFKTYIAAIPTDATALNELGEIMLEKEEYAAAILYFEQGLACEVIPNTRALMHNLIVAYEFNGDFDKAWELVQEYVILFPEDEDAQREYVFLKNRQMKEEE
ncbi:MAG: tetratricopeptide repeat protein [Roseburia sp.]|nr:tetratricopeptide repeat protein [Roseburia sp.]